MRGPPWSLFQIHRATCARPMRDFRWIVGPDVGHAVGHRRFWPSPSNLTASSFTGGGAGRRFCRSRTSASIELVFPGEQQTETFDLQDDPGPQKQCLKAPPQRLRFRFDIRILNTYPN